LTLEALYAEYDAYGLAHKPTPDDPLLTFSGWLRLRKRLTEDQINALEE